MVKAVILVGGPGKGTRFRPLSLEVPKPLFPLAGRAMIEHHIKACSELNDMQEVCLRELQIQFEIFRTEIMRCISCTAFVCRSYCRTVDCT